MCSSVRTDAIYHNYVLLWLMIDLERAALMHVSVIIFKVEARVRLGYTSSTSQQCSWNETHTDKVNLYYIVKVLLFSTFRLNYIVSLVFGINFHGY